MYNFNSKKIVFLSLLEFKEITNKISKELNCNFILLEKRKFANSEILISCKESLDNKEVIFFHSIGKPVNEKIMELFISLEAIRKWKIKNISLIIPFLAYGRQDRPFKKGEPATFKMIAELINFFKIKKIFTFNLHSKLTEKFFKNKIINLDFTNFLLKKLLEKKISNLSLVAPDLGRKEQIQKLSKKLKIPMIQIYKKRPKYNDTIITNFCGEIENKNLILIDDMIDTGNTLLNSIKFLKEKKSNDIFILSIHGIFSKNSIKLFEKKYKEGVIKKILISDTIIQKKSPCLEIITISNYLIKFFKEVNDKKTFNIFLKNYEKYLNNE